MTHRSQNMSVPPALHLQWYGNGREIEHSNLVRPKNGISVRAFVTITAFVTLWVPRSSTTTPALQAPTRPIEGMRSSNEAAGVWIHQGAPSRTGGVKRVAKGTAAIVPPAATDNTPKAGSEFVPVDIPLAVKYSKPIELNAGTVFIEDEAGTRVSGISLHASGRILTIDHHALMEGKKYTVTVPPGIVKDTDNVPSPEKRQWSFSTEPAVSRCPLLINMTFNGDPKTSIAFDWYTSKYVAGTMVQVALYSKIRNDVFPEAADIRTFTGRSEVISTFMTTDARGPGYKSKFASHKAMASDLTPGTKYAYRVGSGDPHEWSEIGSFSTDTAENMDYHFVVTTDTQGSEIGRFRLWQDTFQKAVGAVNPKFVALTGDMTDDGDIEKTFQWFMGLPRKEFANVPFVPVLGSHETNDQSNPNRNFFYHFNLPEDVGIDYRKDPGTGEAYEEGSVYSFEVGDALFMILNSQYEGELTSDKGGMKWVDPQFTAQLNWMRNRVAQTGKTWKFVLLHKGPYTAGDNAGPEWSRVEFTRRYLCGLFDELGVDVVFQGHDHMYMRSHLMFNREVQPDKLYEDEDGNVVNPKGTIYMMTGTAAGKFYEKNKKIDDYFAARDEQPHKKLFEDVHVTRNKVTLTAYTAAQDEGIREYDKYCIVRNDRRPDVVRDAQVRVVDRLLVITWRAPETSEGITEYRIYEKSGRMDRDGIRNWTVFVPAVKGQSEYRCTVDNADINSEAPYEFIIRSASQRLNSDAVSVLTSRKNTARVIPERGSWTVK